MNRARFRRWGLAAFCAIALPCRAGVPPAITRHPVSQQAAAGSSVTLIGGTSDIAADFQWEKDGVPVPGATGAILTIRHLQPADSGDYQLIIANRTVISGGPDIGESASRVARVDVLMPLRSAGQTDLSFMDALPTSSNVRAVVVLDDGRCMSAGAQLILLRPDGTPDPAFLSGNPNTGGTIRAIARHGDGWLAGGDFTSWNGRSVSRIVRLNATGQSDPAFLPPVLNSTVRVIAVHEGSAFLGLSGAPWLMKLRPDGSADAAFQAKVIASGINERVTALVVQPDGRIFLGGRFFAGGAWPYSRIARLRTDGSADVTGTDAFRPVQMDAPGTEVLTLALQPNGRILAGGTFTAVAGQTRFYLARFLANGDLDPGFDPAPGDPVYSLAVQPDGQVLVGGDFARIAGRNVRGLARLTSSGAVDGGWRPPGFDDRVAALALTADGRVLAGGSFTQPHSGIVRLNGVSEPGVSAGGPQFRVLEPGRSALITLPVSADDGSTFTWKLPDGTVILTTVPSLFLDHIEARHHGDWKITVSPSLGSALEWDLSVTVSAPSAGARPFACYTVTGLPWPVPAFGDGEFPVQLPALNIDELTVTLDLLHAEINDVAVSLTPPRGAVIQLLEAGVVRRGSHLSLTHFADAAPQTVYDGTAPFAGTWRPGGGVPLSTARGQMPAGRWLLRVTDTGADSTGGTLRYAALEIHGPLPAAPEWSIPLPLGPGVSNVNAGGRILVNHWPAPPGNALTYQFSTDLIRWLPAAPFRVRILPDQARHAYFERQPMPSCWFRAGYR